MAVAKTGHCSGNLWQLHAEPFTFRLKGIYLGLGLSCRQVAATQQQQQPQQHRELGPALSKSAAAAAAVALAPANEVRRTVLEMLQNANKLLL